MPKELTTPNQTKRYNYFHLFLAVDMAAFIILIIFVTQNPYFPFDLIITRYIQQINFPGFEGTMIFLTELGYFNLGTLTTLAAALIVSLLTKKWRDGTFVIISTVGAYLLAITFKFIINRPRPDISLINQIGQAAAGSSFPSGHVLHFVGLYGFLLYLAYTRIRNHLRRYIAVTILGLLILLISLSRIDLGAHWFSDVLGSYLIGVAWLYVVTSWYRRGVKQSLKPSSIIDK